MRGRDKSERDRERKHERSRLKLNKKKKNEIERTYKIEQDMITKRTKREEREKEN